MPTPANKLKRESERQDTTVLLVTDDPVELATIRRHLEASGFRTITAVRSEDAVRVLRTTRVDVLVATLDMPGLSGAELLVHARTHHPEVRRIAMTTSGPLGAVAKAVNEGDILRLITGSRRPQALVGALHDALRPEEHELVRGGSLAGLAPEGAWRWSDGTEPARRREDLQPRASLAQYRLDRRRLDELITKLQSCGLAGLAEVLRKDVSPSTLETLVPPDD